jgi:hypothetical protein
MPEMLPPDDLNGKICVGELGIAWVFYKEIIEKEKWMDQDRQIFLIFCG